MILNLLIFFFTNTSLYIIVKKYERFEYFLDKSTKRHAIHDSNIFKLGGLFILINSLLIILLEINNFSDDLKIIFLYSILVSLVGIYEDFKPTDKFSWRLLIIIFISLIFTFLNSFYVNNLNIGLEFLDNLLENYVLVKILVTIFCINTIVHSFNFMDGVNGNLNFFILSILVSILFVLSKEEMFINDYKILWNISFLLIISIFFFNYPKPVIFMGDGGAYFMGFLISSFLILMSNNISHDRISIWYYANLMIFPFTEMFISFFRRIAINKQKPTIADKKHLHHLIMDTLNNINFIRLKSKNYKNSLTAIVVLLIYIFPIIFTTIYYYNQAFLKLIFYVSFILYIITYYFIFKFVRNAN